MFSKFLNHFSQTKHPTVLIFVVFSSSKTPQQLEFDPSCSTTLTIFKRFFLGSKTSKISHAKVTQSNLVEWSESNASSNPLPIEVNLITEQS